MTGVQIGIAGVSFFWTYIALHLLHAAGHDPAALRALGAIPLFARFLASAACAGLVAVAAAPLDRNRARWLPLLPATLAASVVAFSAVVVLVP